MLLKSFSALLALAAVALAALGAAVLHGSRPQAAAPVAVHPSPSLAALVRRAPARRAAPAAKPRAHARPAAHVEPPVRATISLYESTTDLAVVRQQGCHAARRGVGGIVILDFGQPAYNGHTYGTNLFSGAFAGNREITQAMLAYAKGYAGCLAGGSNLSIALARGTSNYHPQVPSPYSAGRRWARETNTLAQLLRAQGLDRHVESAAGDDVEPAWDPSFYRTRDFFRGYRDAHTGHLIYDYGSLDGGVGGIWNARQVFYVASGMRETRVIPEIYNHTMARQWAYLAHLVKHRYHRPVQFAGVMTTHTSSNHGMQPPEARRSLVRALANFNAPATVPATATNIRAAY